ncbi:unnamed protein product [Allacma fusca]|uniref:C2 domain-containing protein n=1 Tax=Allacma fusca TaxID=39272 RepID=A0A8J2PLC1_9HEXA|nr:unnamed protein product [Allacma fusca]
MKTLHLIIFSVLYFKGAFAAPLDTSNVTFALSAKSLPCKDQFTQPDAYVQIYSYIKSMGADNSQKQLQVVGSTPYILNDMNPDWSEVFNFMWTRGTGQTWLIKVFDHDHVSSNDLIGSAEVSVDRFLESEGNVKVNLSHGGSITIKRVLPIAFKLSARNLPHRDRYIGSNGISDPYAIISYQDLSDDTEKEIHQTGVLTDNENPTWSDTIEFNKYIPNARQTLHIRLFDRDLFSRDEFLGEAHIKADELTEQSGNVIFPLEKSEGGASIILRMPHRQKELPTETSTDLHLTSSQPIYTPTTPESASTSNEEYIHHYDNEIHDEIPK